MNLTENDYEPTAEDVRILRQWLKKMPHLLQDYDDTFLATFIKGKKGSLQKAKLVLEKFNSAGMLFPEFFDDFDILNPISQKCLKETIILPLGKRLDDGAHVFVMGFDYDFKDTKKSNLIEMWRYVLMLFYVLSWENNPFTNHVTIFDWKSLKLGHAKDINPVFLGRLIAVLKCLPIRILAVYNINVPPSLEWVLNMIKSVATNKLSDRLHFISSIDTLYQHIPREMLPKDYGGPQEDLKTMHSRWMRKVESYRDRLLEENKKMRALDPLRPINEDPQDMIGTFKALNVD